MTPPLVRLETVSKVFRSGGHENVALDGFSLDVLDEGRTAVAIAGESGSGKTVMSRILLGLMAPSSGRMLYRGEPLGSGGRAQELRFRREVQPVFQDPYEVFNPVYKVDHALWMAVKRFRLADRETEGRQLIESALEMVGLRPKETLGRHPHQLSGGQRQRIMVARALLVRPRLIVADEPVSMVDASLRATILSEIDDARRRFGISVVYITHDLTTAYQLCRDIVVLYRGRVAEAGPIEDVIGRPRHPYTQLLVRSIPGLVRDPAWAADDAADLAGGGGAPAGGCLFADRCRFASGTCSRTPPPLREAGGGRRVACHHADVAGEADWRVARQLDPA